MFDGCDIRLSTFLLRSHEFGGAKNVILVNFFIIDYLQLFTPNLFVQHLTFLTFEEDTINEEKEIPARNQDQDYKKLPETGSKIIKSCPK